GGVDDGAEVGHSCSSLRFRRLWFPHEDGSLGDGSGWGAIRCGALRDTPRTRPWGLVGRHPWRPTVSQSPTSTDAPRSLSQHRATLRSTPHGILAGRG